jgi:hypothetical protein
VTDLADSAIDPVLAQVDALVAEGRNRQAIDVLSAALRTRRSPELARRAVQLRHRSFVPPASAAPFTPPTARPLPEPGILPSIRAGELDATRLREGLATHGCLLVRNLISPDRAAGLARGIDRALAGFDAAKATDADDAPDELAGWYSQFTPDPGQYRVGGRRNWVRATGAMWTADSPFMLAALIELIDETGVGAVVTEYLGERPALSANKCTLRRVPLTTNVGWHQDGAFLGEHTRTVNLWLALGHCGRTAPGMDIVPRRVDHVIETGTGDAIFDWSVGTETVREQAGEAGVVRPEFGPGDALLFDHLFLHSTCVEPTMTSERHAMETWFFAPSAYPEGQIPLVY